MARVTVVAVVVCALIVVVVGILILGAVLGVRALRGGAASERPPKALETQVKRAGTEPEQQSLPKTLFFAPDLVPDKPEEIAWFRCRQFCLAREDHPELFRDLHRLLGEVSERHARPGDPGIDHARWPLIEAPWFAIGLRDGRVVLGDEFRLRAADDNKWPREYTKLIEAYTGDDRRGPLVTSPSLRLRLPPWRVTRLYRCDLPLGEQRWMDARGPYMEEARALAEAVLPSCPSVVGGEPGELGAMPSRMRDRGYYGVPCIIQFSRPVTLRVFRPEWDPTYYCKPGARDWGCAVTRAENVRCDQVALYCTSEAPPVPPSARVYYHLAGGDGWLYVGGVTALRERE
jgi:hypothetical protein